MARLFGTDGVRGVAISELTCELAMNIGRATVSVISERVGGKVCIAIGKDTRISSDVLEAALVAGITSMGADVQLLGVLPTPALAYIVEKEKVDAGIMISASHNTVEYNGLKVFSSNGIKLSDEEEDEIERRVKNPDTLQQKQGSEIGRVKDNTTAIHDYIEHIKSSTLTDLSGMKILVDCANGSASRTAAAIFTGLGASCTFLHNQPDGLNINDNCGSTHIENLFEQVRTGGFDAGIAFDGDADRCLAVDSDGKLVDGDKIIAVLAKELKKQGGLKNNTVVGTVMTNFGFLKHMEEQNINTICTKVGDKYVLEEMLKGGYILGGEQSGHIICLNHATTGDGQLTAVQLLATVKQSGKKLSELSGEVPDYPQLLIGVSADADKKAAWEQNQEVQAVIDEAQRSLVDNGRVLVRASGTEPLIRVMVEGKNENDVTLWATKIAQTIEKDV